MPLSSVDFANILRNMAYKRHLVNLNKTQVNKLLFICYGLYLAFYGEKLFSETPKAWRMVLFSLTYISCILCFVFLYS